MTAQEEDRDWAWIKMKTKKYRPELLDFVDDLETVDTILAFNDDEMRRCFGFVLGSLIICRFRCANRRQIRTLCCLITSGLATLAIT